MYRWTHGKHRLDWAAAMHTTDLDLTHSHNCTTLRQVHIESLSQAHLVAWKLCYSTSALIEMCKNIHHGNLSWILQNLQSCFGNGFPFQTCRLFGHLCFRTNKNTSGQKHGFHVYVWCKSRGPRMPSTFSLRHSDSHTPLPTSSRQPKRLLQRNANGWMLIILRCQTIFRITQFPV